MSYTKYASNEKNSISFSTLGEPKSILRYLDSIGTINNTEARALLKLQVKDYSIVSRLFAELVEGKEIEQTEDCIPNSVEYRSKRR